MKTFDQFWTEFGAGIAWNPDSKDAARRVWLAARAGMNVDNEAAFDQLLHDSRELAQQDADAFGMGFIVDGQRVAPHRVQVFAPAAKATGTAGELPPLPDFSVYRDDFRKELEHHCTKYGQACAQAARQPAPALTEQQRNQIHFAAEVLFSRGYTIDSENLRAILAATNQGQR